MLCSSLPRVCKDAAAVTVPVVHVGMSRALCESEGGRRIWNEYRSLRSTAIEIKVAVRNKQFP